VANQPTDIKTRLLATFRVEAEEHLQAITTHLMALERGLPPAEARVVVETTFREVHTLKGAARSVSLMDIETLCQACESVLSRITREQLGLSRPILNGLQEAIDGVARLVAGRRDPIAAREIVERLERAAELAAEKAEPAVETEVPPADAAAEPAGPGPAQIDTIRLATAKLDALLFQAEDLLSPKLAAGERVREARALVDQVAGFRTALDRVPAARPLALATRRDGQVSDLRAAPDSDLRSLEAQARGMLDRLVRDQRAIARTIDGLQEEMRRIRMMPASTILDLFPRMVRDLARDQGKEVEWVAQGTDLEVDRKVLEGVKEPLIHLVRNAVDHGIEAPPARAHAGKAPRGRVAVTFSSLEGGRIEICVEDDGSGLDPAQVREAAVRLRLLSPQDAQGLTDQEALDLVYRSGLSTSPIITDLSGHGLGLAIVKERAERLGGQISLATRAGAGTTVRMILPAAIATFRGLLVQAGGQSFLLPTEAVERAIRVVSGEAESVEGREMIRWNGRPLSLARLGWLLGLPDRDDETEPGRTHHPCVIMRFGEERVGLLVQEILEEQEVLVKELRPPLVRVRNVAGAGLLGTGQVVLILRPADLFKSVRQSPRPAAPSAAVEERDHQMVILVVDDSITTRTMEKNLLEAAGYQVRVAVDGSDAWRLLKSEQFDLVVSDVDMPRMDGFDLTARIRGDRKLAELPVVLVTALESREDKERGIEVGANAYLIKSTFDQSNLLEIIRRLV
jgi:two-component system chemotaxis sensor kinase CheA